MDTLWLALPGLGIWAAVLLVPWRPWSTREALDAVRHDRNGDLASVTVLIPARDEAETIAQTIRAAAAQGKNHSIVVIDDQSADGTAARANTAGAEHLIIVPGEPLPPGWTGKLWALEQGRMHAKTPHLLLLDADIELLPGTIAALLDKSVNGNFALVSLMARLRMENVWEKMLMPAFIFFFKLLYPFRLANSASPYVAAAAGGCILIRSAILEEIGGFGALRNELIDDCSLARHVKNAGHRTWIGLTHSAISRRRYQRLRSIWTMVARTAYTQLRHSFGLLVLCTALMLAAFVLPVLALLQQDGHTLAAGAAAILLMFASYMPTLRFYELGWWWAAPMPVAGALFLLMTWSSAWRHWRGTGAVWKERSYGGSPPPQSTFDG
jgi:hopene-associated glycosyltransferase HpnB